MKESTGVMGFKLGIGFSWAKQKQKAETNTTQIFIS
jgi:hypothetical protein